MSYKLIVLFVTASIFCQANIFSGVDKNLMHEWFHFPERIMIELDPIQTLIQYGNNPQGLRPLNHAIEINHYEAAALLVDYTENINVMYGESPLYRFFQSTDTELRIRGIEPYPPMTSSELKFLAKLCSRLDDEGLASALSSLIQRKWFDAAECLIEIGVDINKGALSAAIRSGNLALVASLLERGAIITKNRGDLTAAVKSKNIELVKLLVSHGIDKNDSTDGCTPLVQAIQLNELAIAEYLLQSGADPNRKCNPNSGTPLAFAIRIKNDRAIALLVRYGART